MRGITTLADAVKSTLGPGGRPALIESEQHSGGVTITKDGVTVANSITVMDPYENLGIRVTLEAAQNTATQAGDGTTTSIVLAESLLLAADEHLEDDNNVVEVTRHISNMTDSIVKDLESRSEKVSGEILHHVATVSANNDPELGGIIADAYNKVGESGVVTVEMSKTPEIHSEITKGIRFNRGLMSNLHITDARLDTCELENPYVLVSDLKINSFSDIQHILEYAAKVNNRPIVIIGRLELEAQATINLNLKSNIFKGAYILPPEFGFRAPEMMEDLAISLGGKYITDKLGTDWQLIDPAEFLGEASKVTIGRDSTSIIHDSSESTEATNKRIEDIKAQLKNEKREEYIESARNRIAILEGNAAIIYVGATSSIEEKELKDRVDDAVLATRASIEEGILPGGGIALLDSVNFPIDSTNHDCVTAMKILSSALIAPFDQIMTNAGVDPEKVREEGAIGDGKGYNAKTKKYGDMYEMGIIDPAKVTKNALKNAVSVATTIMTSDTVITNVRDTR